MLLPHVIVFITMIRYVLSDHLCRSVVISLFPSLLMLALMFLVVSPAQAQTLMLSNQTERTLVPYRFSKVPGELLRDFDNRIEPGEEAEIDISGSNLIFTDESFSTTGTEINGFFLGFGLSDSPPVIQYKLIHYRVPPGQNGKDPSKGPIIINQVNEDVSSLLPDILMIVHSGYQVTFDSVAKRD